MMLEPLINAIKDSVIPVAVGNGYYSKNVYLPPKKPQCEPLLTSSLQSVVDFCELYSEQIELVHVNHRSVYVYSRMTFNFERECLLIADTSVQMPVFNTYLPSQEFIVMLQSQFLSGFNQDAEKLMKIVGTIKSEAVRTLSDDGITQIATVQSGISRAATVEIENPFYLQPIRTFIEIEQPISSFIFRLKTEKDEQKAALIESDGQLWRVSAINRITEFINNGLNERSIDIHVIG